MNSEEEAISNESLVATTPQERTGISLLTTFEPDIWVVVDGGHPYPNDAIGSGAGAIILQHLLESVDSCVSGFTLKWQHYSYPIEGCNNSNDAEIWAAVKGLEQVSSLAGKQRICLISDNSAVYMLRTQLLVIELGLKNAQRYARELEISPYRELADLYLQLQPCQIQAKKDLIPEGFNLVLLAAHQAAHDLATKAAMSIRH